MEQLTRSQTLRSRTNARAGRGFSLIELMAALGILAFGILAATASQVASMKVAAESRNRTVAMNLAEQSIEIFDSMTPDDVLDFLIDPDYPNDPANPIDPDPGDGATMQFDRSWLIEPGTPEAGGMTITVWVSWEDASGTVRNAQIQTLMVDP